MRHGKKFNHLGRKSAHRKSMLANMACSLNRALYFLPCVIDPSWSLLFLLLLLYPPVSQLNLYAPFLRKLSNDFVSHEFSGAGLCRLAVLFDYVLRQKCGHMHA